MAQRIDGKAQAKDLRDRVAVAAAAVMDAAGRMPGLGVVLVGEDPASQVYVRNKVKLTKAAGMVSVERRLPASASQADVEAEIDALNADPSIDGILLQLPLPKGLDADAAIARIDPSKDVDGLTEISAGRLVLGRPGFQPCTPVGSVLLAKSIHPDLTGMDAVVIGRSILVGKPLALLLQAENATVTMAHSRSRNLQSICQRADLLFVAAGRPALIPGSYVKPGATVIDIGINRIDDGQGGSKLVGDVDYEGAAAVAGAITPVPGGVGPMTIACLLRNTVLAAVSRLGLETPPDL